MQVFSGAYDEKVGVCLTVFVFPGWYLEEEPVEVKPVKAVGLFDTGARYTQIHMDLATDMGLPSEGVHNLWGTAGTHKGASHKFSVGFVDEGSGDRCMLPIFGVTHAIPKFFDIGPKSLMILGRDIIQQGELVIGSGNRWKFSIL